MPLQISSKINVVNFVNSNNGRFVFIIFLSLGLAIDFGETDIIKREFKFTTASKKFLLNSIFSYDPAI